MDPFDHDGVPIQANIGHALRRPDRRAMPLMPSIFMPSMLDSAAPTLRLVAAICPRRHSSGELDRNWQLLGRGSLAVEMTRSQLQLQHMCAICMISLDARNELLAYYIYHRRQ